jgi:hypothetical protein
MNVAFSMTTSFVVIIPVIMPIIGGIMASENAFPHRKSCSAMVGVIAMAT